MARLKAPLAMLLVLLMFMAGCIYSDTPEWGTGDGQIQIEIDTDERFSEGNFDFDDSPVYSEEQTENGGDVLAHIKMESGLSYSWDSIDVRVNANGTEHECVELSEADAEGLKCTYTYTEGDGYWDVSEEITISEGANADLVSRDENGDYIYGLIDFLLSVEDSADGTIRIQSKLGAGYSEDVPLISCYGEYFKVTGLLISSTIYETHNDDNTLNSATGAAVIIHKMTWSDAESIEEGTAARVNLKNWDTPSNPQEAVGSKISTNEDDWAVIGIVPGSENVADGLNVLEHWHQPIELSGYILDSGTTDFDENCVVEGQGHTMIITNIRTEEGVVSIDGESDDEYYLGDTDVFGRWSFVIFFLVVAGGGGVGLFILSTMIIRQGAKATAESLLGREGLAKVVQLKRDLKSSKKEGLESSVDRTTRERKNNPPPKKKSEEDVAIPGFSLDNVLASGGNDDSPKTFGGGSVVVTSEAKQIQSQPVVSSPPVQKGSMSTTNVVSAQSEPVQQRGHFSTSAPGSQTAKTLSSPVSAKKPVKRRSVKKRAVKSEPEFEPESAPVSQNKTASVADDDDFSDFSF